MTDKTILVVGTWDTKDAELLYLCDRITEQGGSALTMDVSVLGDPSRPTNISKHQVAGAGGSSIQAAINADDENLAMQIMAAGASKLAAGLQNEGRINAALVLGGSMGTDLALVCAMPCRLACRNTSSQRSLSRHSSRRGVCHLTCK